MDAQYEAPDTDPHWLILVMDSVQHWGEARFIICVVDTTLFKSFRIASADTTALDPSSELVASVFNALVAKESEASRRMLMNMGSGSVYDNPIATAAAVLLQL